ncbi:MAG: hypothetical protein R3C97_16470 [Geminicoccaceae bacterium]
MRESWGQRGGRHERLEDFVEEALGFSNDRDFPAKDGVSRLFAYLHAGLISPRQIVARLQTDRGRERVSPICARSPGGTSPPTAVPQSGHAANLASFGVRGFSME